MARQLTEIARNMVLQQVQNNIVAALAEISADRDDPSVNMMEPVKYYTFYPRNFQQSPSAFVIVQSMDFMKEKMGANFIDATVNMTVGVLVENRQQSLLVTQCDRYGAALDQILDQVVLDHPATPPTTQAVRGVCIVNNMLFSEEFKPQRSKAADPENIFHKFVALDLAFRHFESF